MNEKGFAKICGEYSEMKQIFTNNGKKVFDGFWRQLVAKSRIDNETFIASMLNSIGSWIPYIMNVHAVMCLIHTHTENVRNGCYVRPILFSYVSYKWQQKCVRKVCIDVCGKSDYEN